MDFGSLSASLNLNISNFVQGLTKASVEVKKFGKGLTGQLYDADDAVKALDKNTLAYGLTLKSVSRVVSGIIISQAFYKSLQAVRNATDAVWEFTQQLEYAEIAYSNLFGSTELATEFINVLKDFAAKTPFTFSESEKAAKRLLAYGVEYKNVMYVMQGVLSAATMQGDMSKIEPISRALGQIYTNGRLMGQEVRQLAEAGIPVYEILSEKLGITQEQMRNLGREAIPASKAINALVDGMNERFGGVLQASSLTITGLISNIKDNATMLMSAVSEPLTKYIKAYLVKFGDFFYQMRSIAETSGIGGVFEALVPEGMRDGIKQFIASVMDVYSAVKRLVQAIISLLKPVMLALMSLFKSLSPIIVSVANALTTVIYGLSQNAAALKFITKLLAAAAAMWVVFKLKALASMVVVGVANLISKAMVGLAAVLTFVTTHPFWSLAIIIAGLTAAGVGMFDKIGEAAKNFVSKLTGIQAVDPDKLLLPSQKDRVADLNKFNEALDTTADAMDDVADSTGNAAKAGKSLLSFDEVFRLKDADEGTDEGVLDSLDDILGELQNIGSFMPEIDDLPDISSSLGDFVDGYVSGFVDLFKGTFTDKLKSAGIGAIIGAILGGAIGGVPGAKVGAAIGGLAGWFWDELATQLGLSDVGKIALPIGTLLGAAIGSVVGGPAGVAVGAAIGTLAGWLIDKLVQAINGEENIAPPAAALGALLGAVIGGAMGGPVGAVIGAAIGGLAGWLIGLLADKFKEGDAAIPAAALGALIGGGIGMIVGGPVGAAIGAAIGGLAGWIINKLAEGFALGDWDHIGVAIGAGLGAGIGGIIGGPVGAAIGAAIGALVGWIVDLLVENWPAITAWFEKTGTAIGDWFSDVGTSISTWFTDTKNSISTWFDDVTNKAGNWTTGTLLAMVAWLGETGGKISTWFTDTKNSISTWFDDITNKAGNWAVGTLLSITAWFGETGGKISAWFKDTKESVSNWFNDLTNKAGNWSVGTLLSMTAWLGETGGKIATWFNDTKSSVTDWFKNIGSDISGFGTKTHTSITTWFTTAGSSIANWFSDTTSKIGGWLGTIVGNVSGWFTGLNRDVGGWSSDIFSTVKGGFTSIIDAVGGWMKSIYDAVFGWVDNIKQSISGAFSAISDLKKAASEKVSGWWNNATSSISNAWSSVTSRLSGHATGGVFNREHVARFAEGNKAEAIIPLENNTAMRPFVDAVSQGVIESLAPAMLQSGGSSNGLPPLYVGTLIADDRGLKELYKKFEVIQVQENARRGLAT